MFIDEELRISPKINIDFTIDLVLGVAPMFKTPYKMCIPKLLEMKIQLQELLGKKYTHTSVFPCKALVLFVENKD